MCAVKSQKRSCDGVSEQLGHHRSAKYTKLTSNYLENLITNGT